jgi:hypothetical protein
MAAVLVLAGLVVHLVFGLWDQSFISIVVFLFVEIPLFLGAVVLLFMSWPPLTPWSVSMAQRGRGREPPQGPA